jgi:hypothetical protein
LFFHLKSPDKKIKNLRPSKHELLNFQLDTEQVKSLVIVNPNQPSSSVNFEKPF